MLAVAWVWVIARTSMEWNNHVQFERRRIEEARHLVETMCSTAIGANLAREFAKCEEAHVTVANGTKMVWLRAFEKTIRGVSLQIANHVGAMTVGALAHATLLLLVGGALLVGATVVARKMGWVETPTELDMLSPIAQARFQASNLRINYASDKKYE